MQTGLSKTFCTEVHKLQLENAALKSELQLENTILQSELQKKADASIHKLELENVALKSELESTIVQYLYAHGMLNMRVPRRAQLLLLRKQSQLPL